MVMNCTVGAVELNSALNCRRKWNTPPERKYYTLTSISLSIVPLYRQVEVSVYLPTGYWAGPVVWPATVKYSDHCRDPPIPPKEGKNLYS